MESFTKAGQVGDCGDTGQTMGAEGLNSKEGMAYSIDGVKTAGHLGKTLGSLPQTTHEEHSACREM